MNKKILMPTALTAENGAKGALIGEYHEEVWVDCPECHSDGEESALKSCEVCLGEDGGCCNG